MRPTCSPPLGLPGWSGVLPSDTVRSKGFPPADKGGGRVMPAMGWLPNIAPRSKLLWCRRTPPFDLIGRNAHHVPGRGQNH